MSGSSILVTLNALRARLARKSMIPKKPVPDLIRDVKRFSGKILLHQ